MTAPLKALVEGQKVKGRYLGMFPFTGVIRSIRDHTMNHTAVEFTVDLDTPILVFGENKTLLLVSTQFDGSPCSLNQYTERLEVVY